MTVIERLSLNQWTTRCWSVREAVDGCVRHGIPAIGLWREAVAKQGLAATAKLVTDAGLRVSSLCRGGFLTGPDRGLGDNRAAIDEAATLGAACLVLVVGGLPGVAPGGARGPGFSRDLADARARVADGLTALVPYAADRGVRLALEPLHPMYCADRAVLSTLGQALDLAEGYPAEQVGVVVDTFHLWWDPEVLTQIARAAGRIAGYQVSDFLVPLPADTLLGRGMMGDGVIDFAPLTAAVNAAGYRGDIEVEIFNADIWATDPDEVVATMKRRFARYVNGCLAGAKGGGQDVATGGGASMPSGAESADRRGGDAADLGGAGG
ncbi:sugar phosphate isomerase/epimerase family protein [Sphaerisporangium melleum]|uniref:sugar phosphate isomerase/epimerase family protein n=1 Tax=Sphaerisporangium melleum TaxID=321316 RepID=UPI0035F0A979